MINGVDVARSGGERREESIYLMSPRNIDLVSCSSNLSAFSPCLTQVFFHTSLEAVFLIFFFFYFFFLLFAHAFCVNLDTAEQSSVMWVRPWLLGPLYPSDGNDISSLTLGASWPRPRPLPGPAPRGGRSSRGGLSSRRRSSRSPPSPRGPGPPRRSPPRPPRPPPRPLRPSGAPGPVAVSLKLKSMLTTRFWRFTRCGYSTGSSSSSSSCTFSRSFLYANPFFHLGSMSEPSPAFRVLNLGSSFLACCFFHSSSVNVLGSSSLGSSGTPSFSFSPSGLSPDSVFSASVETLFLSSSAFISSSNVPQLWEPPPSRLSTDLTPVRSSPLLRS